MSHYHLEIVMPPTDDIKASVAEIMDPFNENCDDEEHSSRHAFWDWWVIGGRFAGEKLQASFDPEQMAKFHEEMERRKVTVSSFQAGKQELQPASQIPMVDALWHEFFPDAPDGPCPLFSHSNDQYKSESLLPSDVCRLSDCPERLKADAIIIAGPRWNDKTKLQARELLHQSIWNGVTWQDSKWDGSIASALKNDATKSARANDEWRATHEPKPDWLVVTVDYHS